MDKNVKCFFKFFFGMLVPCVLLVACNEGDGPNGGGNTDVKGAYILNEGAWGANNAGVAFYAPDKDAEFIADLYFSANNAAMGDLANDMITVNGNIYVVLNGSKYVTCLNSKGEELFRYSFSEKEGAPRCIADDGEHVYVTQYGGRVSKFSLELNRVATFEGGDNLEGIAELNGKLYVANAYKIDGSGNYVYNNDVIVIDAETMTSTTSVEVVQNPEEIKNIAGRLYVLSKGNYFDVNPAMQEIDIAAGEVKNITHADKITQGNDGLIYCVRSAYDASWKLTNQFFTYNPSTGVVNENSFLQNAPESFNTMAIYMLEVDELSGDIYVATSDYVTTGTVYRFSEEGQLKESFDAGGINPREMIFIEN